MPEIKMVIDNQAIDDYARYYFAMHPRASKKPIAHPYHESMNTWMIMKRPMMNALKQKWKDFITWFVAEQGYANLKIDRCEMHFMTIHSTKRRTDVDNTTPKFILDGFVQAGMVVDDSHDHITKLVLECGYDKDNPRTEITIIY